MCVVYNYITAAWWHRQLHTSSICVEVHRTISPNDTISIKPFRCANPRWSSSTDGAREGSVPKQKALVFEILHYTTGNNNETCMSGNYQPHITLSDAFAKNLLFMTWLTLEQECNKQKISIFSIQIGCERVGLCRRLKGTQCKWKLSTPWLSCHTIR